MEKVFVVIGNDEYDDGTKIYGVYSTYENALERKMDVEEDIEDVWIDEFILNEDT